MKFANAQAALDAERKSREEARAMLDVAKSEERELTADEAKAANALLDQADEAKASAADLRDQEEQAARLAERMEQSAQTLEAPRQPVSRQKAPGSAQARDYASEEIEHVKMFGKYLTGEALSGREQEHMRPRSEKFGSDAQKGMRVPPSVGRAMLGLPVSAIPHLSTDADGGANLFDREYVNQLLQLAPEPTALLSRVTVIPTGTGDIRIPRLTQTDDNEYGGVSFEWIDEGASKPETETKFDQVTIATHEAAGYTEVSHTLMRRSVFDIISLIGVLFRTGMEDFMESAIISGTGSSQALGIVNTSGVREQERATAGEIAYEDLVRMKYALRPQHRARAAWLMQDEELEELELITDTQDRPLFRASMDAGPVDRLIGYPYVSSTRMPAQGADASVWFADLAQYWLAIEQEIVIRTSEHFQFRKNLEALSVYVVFGGRLVQPRAAVKLVDSTS